MICTDRNTLRRYRVMKQYKSDGVYRERFSGKRYDLVKVYLSV